ncbi:hypothetical protein JTB14_010393 [Gonioctena quinquepunctata]|nr:hypothetical protein JTB14_010393 [Gonioctena quinquepunctata]
MAILHSNEYISNEQPLCVQYIVGIFDDEATNIFSLTLQCNLIDKKTLYGGVISLVGSQANYPDLIELFNIADLTNLNFQNISRGCATQLEVIGEEDTGILMKMIDASAKIPYPGMLYYSGRIELGNFDECLSIEYPYDGGRILGKYCLAGLFIPDPENVTRIDLGHKIATCTPDACSAQDFISILRQLNPNVPPILIDDYCTTKETGQGITVGFVVMITVFTMIILIMVLSTAYDVYLYKTGNECSNEILLAFSVFSNGRKILSTESSSRDHIQIFNGLKVISMMWIIAGHGIGTFLGGMFTTINKDVVETFRNNRYSGYMDGAHLCVDTFIFMSGFLVAYGYLKGKTRSLKNQLMTVPYFYLHRYLRISPAVIMLYLMTMYVLPKMGSGPYWQPGIEQELKPCREYWWSYILYIQNYVNWDQMCLVPHWYLSVDMQMFVLSPLVLIPTSLLLKRNNGYWHSMVFLLALNIVFIILPITLWIKVPEYDNIYATHTRLMDFYIGFMMGVHMRLKKDEQFLSMFEKKKRSKISFLIWVLVLSGMFLVFFFYQDAEMNQGPTSKAYYFGLSRPAWCVGLCWMVYSSYHGYGGFISWFLTLPCFHIGAKLCYCMYVVHYIVIGNYSLRNRMKWYFSNYIEFHLWCGYFIETSLWAFFWTLAFECPIFVIEKYIFSRGKTRGTRKEKQVMRKETTEIEVSREKYIKRFQL